MRYTNLRYLSIYKPCSDTYKLLVGLFVKCWMWHKVLLWLARWRHWSGSWSSLRHRLVICTKPALMRDATRTGKKWMCNDCPATAFRWASLLMASFLRSSLGSTDRVVDFQLLLKPLWVVGDVRRASSQECYCRDGHTGAINHLRHCLFLFLVNKGK